MKVVFLSNVFAKNMGYLENMLPKYLARRGVETHVIAMDLPPYYEKKELGETYEGFVERLQPGTSSTVDGFTLHIVGHKKVVGYMRMVGLWDKLKSLRPDIVQTTASVGWIPLEAAVYQPFLGYKLFTANHTHASVFPLAQNPAPWWTRDRIRCTLLRTVPGRVMSSFMKKCYAISADCADIAIRFFGIPESKVEISPLGIDTELFSPISSEEDRQNRIDLRQKFGFAETDIVCVYTGRFSEDKNPLLLAQSVANLVHQGLPYRGLFVGNGVQAKRIAECSGCVVHPFVPVYQLKNFFRASDIGVWPTQESMSMLDASACGLPIVVNDTLSAFERIEGNGMRYKLNDLNDMIRVLLALHDSRTREQHGFAGADRMARNYGWETVARQRLQDYEAAVGPRRHAIKDTRPTVMS